MRVMVFGGSFNPPHLAHQQIVRAVLKANLADQVWYLPVGTHDFGKQVLSAKHRLAMLELILPQAGEVNYGRVRIENCELKRAGVSHSADTLDYLAARYPQHQFSFLIGSDNLEKLHLWQDQRGRDFHYLIDHYPVYVYPRANYAFEPFYQGLIALKDLPRVEISSTQVRQALETGVSDEVLKPFLAIEVINYLRDNQLYAHS